METKLSRISARSAKDSKCEFKWLMPLFSVENLSSCFRELSGTKALGVDRVTKDEYETHLEENLTRLVERMKMMSYKPQPVLQVEIPKATGGTRPLGISCLEDKIVQTAMAKILGAIYEPTFRSVSYGFRPKRGCHDAIRTTQNYLFHTPSPSIVEIDFANFFGCVSHDKLLSLLELRIKDKTFLRYVSRLLKSEILSRGRSKKQVEGVTQGSIALPFSRIYSPTTA